MNTRKPDRQEAGEALEGLHLLLAGVEAELRSLHTHEAALDIKRESLKEKEVTIIPFEEHTCNLQRMVTELKEGMQSVEGKIASLKAKAKFLDCLEDVAKSRNANFAVKEDLILTRLARTLEGMDHFEPLCHPQKSSQGDRPEQKETTGDQVLVEVCERSTGHWIQVGPRVFYLHFVTGEVWLRLQ